MFKDIDALFAAVELWATKYPLLGFLVMAVMGGFVATVMMYQKAGIVFTWPNFFARLAAKGVIAAFLAFVVFFCWRNMGWSHDWGYIVAGICGIGGSDIAEALVVILIDRIRQQARTLSGASPAPTSRGTPGDERTPPP